MPRWQFWDRVPADEPRHACPPSALKFANLVDREARLGPMQFDVIGFEERIAFHGQTTHGQSVLSRGNVVRSRRVQLMGWQGTGNQGDSIEPACFGNGPGAQQVSMVDWIERATEAKASKRVAGRRG